MKKLLGAALAAATIAFFGAFSADPAAAASADASAKRSIAADAGHAKATDKATDMSAQRRWHRHRHWGPRVYPRRFYPSYGYYRPRPYYYGPRYYRPYYGPSFSFGFGPRYW